MDSPSQRRAEVQLLQALAMMQEGIRLKCATLRQQHPTADEGEIDRLLRRWLARDDE